MAVMVTYSFSFRENIDPPLLAGSADAASLADGGVAVVGDYGLTQTSMSIFQPDGDIAASGSNLAGRESAVAQLSNGRIVVASDTGGEASFTIFRADGSVAVPTTASDVTYPDVSGVDVAGLAGGGFVVASQAFIGGTDNDIRLSIRSNNGGLVELIVVDFSTANDRHPSVAALADGGFVVAWDRLLPGGAEELWYAVYEADGTPRLAPTRLDDQGAVNRNACVAALNDGGFAIAYEDTGWSGDTDIDITLARFTASGTFLDWSDVSLNGGNDTDPTMTVLSNGMIAVGCTFDTGSTDTDPLWMLVDPATGERLGAANTGWTAHYEMSTSLAAMGTGEMAAFFTDNDTGAVVGQVLAGTRFSISDSAGDVMLGDDLYDVMKGGGGDDLLFGGLNGDHLQGGGGADTFSIHAGDIQGDVIGGGSGHDRLFVNADADARTATLVSIEEIEFYSPTSSAITVTIAAAQVGAGLDANLLVDGDSGGGDDTLHVTLGGENEVSLAGFAFQDFEANDRVRVTGDADAETIAGSSLRDDISSGGGDDTVNGRGGGDVMGGGGGDDALAGGGGGDVLAGGAGTDTMTGGTGPDRFDFNAVTDSLPGLGLRDVITDFVGNGNLAGDLIDVSTIDANVLLEGDQSFAFIGNAAFSGAGQVRYTNGVLALNTDGDLAAEMHVELTGNPALVAADLVL